jgi:hypothetical protein
VKRISADVFISAEPDAVRQNIMRGLVPFFERRGYKPELQGPDALQLTYRYLSVPAMLGGLLIFPLGILVWIFVRREETVTVNFLREADGTRLLITGDGDRYTKGYVDGIQDEYSQPALLESESAPTATVCSGCGTKLEPEQRFCPSCGARAPYPPAPVS